MKKFCVVFLSLFLFGYNFSDAQLLITSPDFPTDNSSVTITVDATKGNKGLQGFTGNVFLHTGVITSLSTNPSDWKYVQGTWGTTTAPQATSAGTNRWSFTIPNIRQFYGVPAGESILRLTVLFRDQAGATVQRNIDGSDMYVQVYQQGAFAAKFTTPAMQPMYFPIPEPINATSTSIPFTAIASKAANLTVSFNGSQVANVASAATISGTANVVSDCEQALTLNAVEVTTARDTVAWFRPRVGGYPTGARPSGIKDGITYQNNNTEAVFILHAPLKKTVSLIGDFNNWQQTCSGQMTKDGDYFWARVTGLTPGQYYRFQYIVDDTTRIADPYSELVLDPFNDKFIPATTFPNMPAYPEGRTSGGIVGVIRSGETFNWTDQGYVRPNKYNLIVYELLMRDFTNAQSYQVLKDTLPYLKRLGINCIELMPVNEFDGNNSWGYNPAYFFALDKAYGTKQAFKEFVNEAHRQGISVVLDAVLNHATGQSTMALMWWDKAASRPRADNPYMYTVGQHPFNVYNDFKHTETIVKNFTKRFIQYWLTEYKIDGFRWDLSKGFTTKFYSDINLWAQYDQGRVDIWKDYNGYMQSVSPGSYCILEHLGADDEEYELAANGMLLWGKMTANFAENTMGYSNSNAIISRAYWMYRGVWTNNGEPGRVSFIRDKPGLIAYAESHDEERIMVSNLTNGNNTNSSYNARSLQNALARTEGMAAILMSIPGPKMLWQFGEVGYDLSINYCENGTISTTCRTSPKPVKWDYWTTPVPNWRRRLYDAFSAMNRLRLLKPDAFNTNTIVDNTSDLGTSLVKKVVINHSSLKMLTVANFNVNQVTTSITFPSSGTYYDYTRGGTFNAFGSAQNITLNPGEYRVFTDQNIAGGLVTNAQDEVRNLTGTFNMNVYPNPISRQSIVRYELPESGQVHLQLVNIQGQSVYAKNLGFQMKGLQFADLSSNGFSVEGLPNGTYFLSLRIGNQMKTEKIILQR
jgi:glycosidase